MIEKVGEGIEKRVPGTGLEPARVSTHAPQTCLSTNFSIRALYLSNRTAKVNIP